MENPRKQKDSGAEQHTSAPQLYCFKDENICRAKYRTVRYEGAWSADKSLAKVGKTLIHDYGIHEETDNTLSWATATSELLALSSTNQNYKNYSTQSNNFACCFTWL